MTRSKVHTLLAATIVAAAGSMLLVPPATAVHDTGTFELDGNVVTNGPGDWGTVNFGGGSSSILARTGVVADAAPQSIYTGGGSKDDLDIPGWKHKSGSVPDKDDITNAYAVAYNVGGKLVLYAGADRFDNSGDAFMGFWFFQNQVGLGTGGGGGGAPFVGQHAVGDVLVLANFTGGGTTVNIEVLKWVGSGGNVNGTLQRIAGGPGGVAATCSGGLNGDLFCGITNAANPGETPNWTYLSKSGTSSFPAATFFEIGINISDVFAQSGAGQVPCFSSFLAETRSSSSVNATLKDFALHSFPVCGIAVSKQCINPVLAGSSTVGYTVQGQVQNTGFGTLTNLQLSDSPRPLGSVSYYACNGSGLPTGSPIGFNGSLNPLASVCYQSSFTTPVNGEDDTITASASAGSATVTAQATADCPNLQLSPELSVSKTCTTVLASVTPYLAVQVNVAGEVCNIQKTGSTAVSNVVVTDTDVGAGTVNLLGSPQTLAVGECKQFQASYYPATATNRLEPTSSTNEPGLAKFSDTVTASGTAPFSTVTPQTATAECTLCPTCTAAGDTCTTAECRATSGATQTKQFRRTR